MSPRAPSSTSTGANTPQAGTSKHEGLIQLIDVLLEGVALFDGEGATLIHTNTALRHLLATEPDVGFRKELDRFASILVGTGMCDELATAEVRTCTGSYTLRGRHLHTNPLGIGTAVMIAVQRDLTAVADEKQLEARFALTRSEAHVAVLIAAGKSNTEIATALLISRHTARHHTERVFAKLGVRSRAEAACKLLQS